ncbi:MAG: cysteine synthase A [Paraprevotella sp.]|jgi:cysteine synthase A|nr:cysteine synthase A [Paraprevotella sp.]
MKKPQEEKIYHSLMELIGHTPLLELHRIEEEEKTGARILAKIESFNPGGSVKDRTALHMIEKAEEDGTLQQGYTIIEPTSGNTGIGLAWISALKGYRLILTMPDTMSIERRKLLKALGATVILTPGVEGMNGAIQKAKELQQEIPNSFIPQQFSNMANTEAHITTTAEEIWSDTNGNIDIFVGTVGTGGTITGTAIGLKRHRPDIKIVAVEPYHSSVLSGGKPGPHQIQGIGAGFIPKIYDNQQIDRIIPVKDEEAFHATRLLMQREGIVAGISSGAALHAAILLSKEPENKGKTIVVLLPDTGERYLSTALFNKE